MKLKNLNELGLPNKSGVYKFLSIDKSILYIGKATNLKDRTKSYFSKDLFGTRGPLIVKMVDDADTVEWQETETVLEALILEANLIKKHDPKYNTKEKDNKSYNYVCITKDDFPRVITIRGRELAQRGSVLNGKNYKNVFGPYPNGEMLRSALKIIRRIFPFLDAKTLKKDTYEFYKQMELAPDIGVDKAKKRYQYTIKNIGLFFQGEKKKILKSLEKEMHVAAKKMDFENADKFKRQIFALTHINEVSLIKNNTLGDMVYIANRQIISRVEAYDVAHLSGSNMVGSFVVVSNGQKDTDEYRLFNIRGFTSSNDAGALQELISRRLNHPEWQFPDLIVADGNDVQKSVIERELKKRGLDIPVVSVVKDKSHKARAILGDVDLINQNKKSILLANAEVHRFVLSKHKQKRAKNFLPKK